MNTDKKALLVTTVSGFVPQFEMNHVKLLQDMGYEVHYASNYDTPSYGDDNHRLDGTGIVRHQIDFVRSPFSKENRVVYRQLKQLMQEIHFNLVHCHTPMGGCMTRLAAHATHTGPVIYTAHGFHFFKGASLVNWLCYYPMERYLSRFTDQQICINKEDYEIAKRTFHAKYVDYIPGVGIDLRRIPKLSEAEIRKKKEELGLPLNRFLLLSSGEMIKRKNHETILKALHQLGELYPEDREKVFCVVCGHGKLEQELKSKTKEYGLQDILLFPGYRGDMLEILQIADLFVFPSYQEGLPMSLLEAMASGLPILCSDIRGSSDLMGEIETSTDHLEYCRGGVMTKRADDENAYCEAIHEMVKQMHSPTAKSTMGDWNRKRSRQFATDQVIHIMRKIYERLS